MWHPNSYRQSWEGKIIWETAGYTLGWPQFRPKSFCCLLAASSGPRVAIRRSVDTESSSQLWYTGWVSLAWFPDSQS